MPYRIVFDPSLKGYFCETTKTGKTHSKNPLDYTTAKAQLRALYINSGNRHLLHGGSFIPFVKSIPGRLMGFFGTGKRLNYRPQDRALLEKVGDKHITQLRVLRTPLESIFNKVMNLMSFGKFDDIKKRMNYTDFYHLFIVATLDNGQMIRIEKNQTIEIQPIQTIPRGEEMPVSLDKMMSLKSFLDNGERLMGKENYFIYDAVNNNCQVYIKSLLQANGLLTPDLEKFIMQNVADLPEITKAIARATTDFAHKADILISGAGLRQVRKN